MQLQYILEAALDFVFEWFLMLTGRVVACIATLGHCKSEWLFSDDYRTHGAAGALWYTRDGRSVVTATGQMLAGLAFYVAIVLVLVGLSMG